MVESQSAKGTVALSRGILTFWKTTLLILSGVSWPPWRARAPHCPGIVIVGKWEMQTKYVAGWGATKQPFDFTYNMGTRTVIFEDVRTNP